MSEVEPTPQKEQPIKDRYIKKDEKPYSIVNEEPKYYLDDLADIPDIARTLPDRDMLFGGLWHKGELCILYGSMNCGKSILCTQIMMGLAKGSSHLDGQLTNESKPTKIIYFDAELDYKPYANRLKDQDGTDIDLSNFRGKCYRMAPNKRQKPPEGLTKGQHTIELIKEAIKRTGVEVVIIDNITFINSDNAKAKDAAELIDMLYALKEECGISVLVVAHTPKRDSKTPITANDLSGSRLLMDACDSSFAVNAALNDSLVYIKQIKCREKEIRYNAMNVLSCSIGREDSVLQFQFNEITKESKLLTITEESIEERRNIVSERWHQGWSARKISEEEGLHRQTVSRDLKALGLKK